MDYFEVVEARRSVRAYENREVSDEDLRRILECIRVAPTAGNLQAFDVIVVRDRETRKRLALAARRQEFILDAPVTLVFLQVPERAGARYGDRGIHLYSLQDATIACTYAHLAATALGLGSCWVGAFQDDLVREALGAPAEVVPVAMLPIGYAAESPGATPRRSLDQMARGERY